KPEGDHGGRETTPMLDVRRREFITLLGGAAMAWPLPARARQPAVPVVGFLRSTPAAGFEYLVTALRHGLHDRGVVEGRSVAVEYRWAENQPDRLLGLAADLAGRDRSEWPWRGAGSQSRNHDDTDHIRHRSRSGQNRFGRKPKPAGWQHHGCRLYPC